MLQDSCYILIRGTDALSGTATDCFAFLLKKGLPKKERGKNLLPRKFFPFRVDLGEKFFPFRVGSLWVGVWHTGGQTESHKSVSLVKNGEQSTGASLGDIDLVASKQSPESEKEIQKESVMSEG